MDSRFRKKPVPEAELGSHLMYGSTESIALIVKASSESQLIERFLITTSEKIASFRGSFGRSKGYPVVSQSFCTFWSLVLYEVFHFCLILASLASKRGWLTRLMIFLGLQDMQNCVLYKELL